MAAREGHTTTVALLLDRGAHIDDVVPGDESALIMASSEGHLDVVRLLVGRGAQVNLGAWAGRDFNRPDDEWRTPLRMAELHGHAAVARFLRSAGATN
jgi:uncharacterized protein